MKEDLTTESCGIKRIGELAERVDAILLHIDIDIMDSRYVPAFKFPLAPGGQTPEAVMRNIKDVMDTGKVIALTVMDVCFDLRGKDTK